MAHSLELKAPVLRKLHIALLLLALAQHLH